MNRIKVLMALSLLASPAFAQLPDAPVPKPFGITVNTSERNQGRVTKAPYTETLVGAGVSYRFLRDQRMTATITYGYSIQKGTNSLSGSLSYRVWQFRIRAPK